MCCFFFVLLFLPSPSLQLGQVHATLLNLRGVLPSALVAVPSVVFALKFAGIVFCSWTLAGVATICHLVGSFGSCCSCWVISCPLLAICIAWTGFIEVFEFERMFPVRFCSTVGVAEMTWLPPDSWIVCSPCIPCTPCTWITFCPLPDNKSSNVELISWIRTNKTYLLSWQCSICWMNCLAKQMAWIWVGQCGHLEVECWPPLPGSNWHSQWH